MTRSAEFAATMKHGARAGQPDIVVYARRDGDGDPGPRIGLVVAKSVGNAVQRHRVSRRLRHVARSVLAELDPGERIVIRALPGSRDAVSGELEQQLRIGLRRTRQAMERSR
mgnify:CR=1 FL=1